MWAYHLLPAYVRIHIYIHESWHQKTNTQHASSSHSALFAYIHLCILYVFLHTYICVYYMYIIWCMHIHKDIYVFTWMITHRKTHAHYAHHHPTPCHTQSYMYVCTYNMYVYNIMPVYIHIYTHTYTHTHIHTHIYTYSMYVHNVMHVCIHTYIHK